jgi:pyruvate-formate lyase-activating enzyme
MYDPLLRPNLTTNPIPSAGDLVLTRVYHIVQFTNDNSIYMFFRGCNFRCTGCILKLSPWDCHLPNDIRSRLERLPSIETLSLNEIRRIVEPLRIRKAVLGGGEPTIDSQLIDVIKLLHDLNVTTVLLTNGYALDEDGVEELQDAKLDQIWVSIKALTASLHTQYTGKSNRRVLRNFKLLSRGGIHVRAESVLIPQLIEYDEIKSIASFIASVNSSIPYRIDGYIPVKGTIWRMPSRQEMLKAIQEARKHLENVSYIYSGMRLKGNVFNVYPRLKDEPRTDLVS